MRFLNPNRILKKKERRRLWFLQRTYLSKGSMAEWSKAWDSGSHPQGRGFKSLCCHQISVPFFLLFWLRTVPRARDRSSRAQFTRIGLFFFRECPNSPSQLTNRKHTTHTKSFIHAFRDGETQRERNLRSSSSSSKRRKLSFGSPERRCSCCERW